MKIQPQSVAGTDMACAAKKNHVCFTPNFIVLSAIWMLVSMFSLSAQTYSQFSLSEYAYAVATPSATLDEGDTVTFSVSLGSDDVPALHVMGVHIELELNAIAVIPEDIALSVAGSWAFDAANFNTLIKPQDAPPSISIEVLRADYSSTSGNGLIFTFQLVAGENGISSSDFIAAIDGVVIVENIDCKMAQYPRPAASTTESTTTQSPVIQAHAFPNPTQGHLQVPLPIEAGMQAYLVAPDGQAMLLPSEYLTDNSAFDLSNFPAGLYQLQIRQNGKPIWQERILKQ